MTVKPFRGLLTLAQVRITPCKSVAGILCQCYVRPLWLEENNFIRKQIRK